VEAMSAKASYIELIQSYIDGCKNVFKHGDIKIDPDDTMFGGKTLSEEIKLAEDKLAKENSSCT